jgi:hypothetical protein
VSGIHRTKATVPNTAAAEVVDGAAFIKDAQRENMRARQINNVNVIADTGAVPRWIVCAVNRNVAAHTHGCLQYQRNQMRLGIMPLAAAFGCARSIEIAKAGIA